MTQSRIPLTLVGANGMLARMVRERAPEIYDIVPLDLPEFDITDEEQVREKIGALTPRVIINCAAYTNVDGCETEEELATRVNGLGVGYLTDAAKEVEATLVHVSTDYVFDGTKSTPYLEDDPPNPKSAYGRSKLCGEKAILESGLENFFIVRTSWLYGPGGKNFVDTILRLAGDREELGIVADQVGCPTLTLDLADAIFNLLETTPPHTSPLAPHSPYGIYHFSNAGECSWHEFGLDIVNLARQHQLPVKAEHVRALTTEEFPLPAPRPAYSVFSKEKYRRTTASPVPDWRASLKRYFEIR